MQIFTNCNMQNEELAFKLAAQKCVGCDNNMLKH